MSQAPTGVESRVAAIPALAPPLSSVIVTDQLYRRRTRLPDHRIENRGLVALSGALAGTPQNVLQHLVEAALDLRAAQSAGISLLTHDGARFYWPAVAGKLASFVGAGTPREHGPCGTVLDFGTAVLFSRPQRHFTYLSDISPALEEVLLVPFYLEGRAVGTVWALSHDTHNRFDAEDLRVLTTLATFAGAAYQILQLKERLTPSDLLGELLDRERAARLEAEAVTRARDKAFLLVTHDLRGPINAVRGWAALLAAGNAPPDEWAEALEAIAQNSARLTVLVERLLDSVRFQKETIRPLPYPIGGILTAALESAAPAARAKRLTVHTDTADDAWVMADFEAMHQAISNLLFNAIKFTPEGGRIDVRCAPAGLALRIEVTDSGIGLDAAFIPKLFQPFSQADPAARRDGVGLGLSIARIIVEAHHGSVEAHSAGLGRGATFAISLPLASR